MAGADPLGRSVAGVVNQELDRHAPGRDPLVSSIDVQAIAVADRAVMDHQAAFSTPRTGAEMIEIAAFVVDDGRHPSPPQSCCEKFCHDRVTKSMARGNPGRARLHARRSRDQCCPVAGATQPD